MSEYEKSTLDHPGTFVQRPTFLTVLCILTFIVSGYHLITGIIGLFGDQSFDPVQMAEINEQMSEAMDGADASTRAFIENFMNSIAATMRSAVANATAIAWFGILASLLSIGGAYLMFKLRRVGYYVYIAAKVVGILGVLLFLGLNMLTLTATIFLAIVATLFIFLYGTQRKYMI